MTREELQIQLNELIQENLEVLAIGKEDFMTFREIWIHHEEKDSIVGEALHNGHTNYRYRSNKKI